MAYLKKVMVLMVTILLCRVSMAEIYEVGDSAGWTNINHVDYKFWAAEKQFHVGDTIDLVPKATIPILEIGAFGSSQGADDNSQKYYVFKYNKQFHNVMKVTHQHFRDCNSTTPYATYTTGNDSFKLQRRGHLYFICSVPGHCEAGQKVDIRVLNQPSGPRPSPTGPQASPPGPTFDAPAPSPNSMNVTPQQNVGSTICSSWKLWAFAVLMALGCPAIAH